MKEITVWVTSDDVQHSTIADAVRHLEEKRGDIITKLAHQIVRIDKYLVACDWVQAMEPHFAELARLEADKTVIGDDDD